MPGGIKSKQFKIHQVTQRGQRVPHMKMITREDPDDRFTSYSTLDVRILRDAFIVIVLDKLTLEDRPIRRKCRYDQKTIYQERYILMKWFIHHLQTQTTMALIRTFDIGM